MTPRSLGELFRSLQGVRIFMSTKIPPSTGVETSNGVLHRLVPRNFILPRRTVANFTTSEDGRELPLLLVHTISHLERTLSSNRNLCISPPLHRRTSLGRRKSTTRHTRLGGSGACSCRYLCVKGGAGSVSFLRVRGFSHFQRRSPNLTLVLASQGGFPLHRRPR